MGVIASWLDLLHVESGETFADGCVQLCLQNEMWQMLKASQASQCRRSGHTRFRPDAANWMSSG